jgi:hypothetical protein
VLSPQVHRKIWSWYVSDETPQIHVELAFAMKQEIGGETESE